MCPTQLVYLLGPPRIERGDTERLPHLRIRIPIIGISSIRSNIACFRGSSGWAESRKKPNSLKKEGSRSIFGCSQTVCTQLNLRNNSGVKNLITWSDGFSIWGFLGACPSIRRCSRIRPWSRSVLAVSAQTQTSARTVPLNSPRRGFCAARSSEDCASGRSVATQPRPSPGLAGETGGCPAPT